LGSQVFTLKCEECGQVWESDLQSDREICPNCRSGSYVVIRCSEQ